jgi:hypothetical protein
VTTPQPGLQIATTQRGRDCLIAHAHLLLLPPFAWSCAEVTHCSRAGEEDCKRPLCCVRPSLTLVFSAARLIRASRAGDAPVPFGADILRTNESAFFIFEQRRQGWMAMTNKSGFLVTRRAQPLLHGPHQGRSRAKRIGEMTRASVFSSSNHSLQNKKNAGANATTGQRDKTNQITVGW